MPFYFINLLLTSLLFISILLVYIHIQSVGISNRSYIPGREETGHCAKNHRKKGEKRRSPVAWCKGEKMQPVVLGVAGPISKRQAHEVSEP